MGRSLTGKHILIVEDEYFIATDLARALEAEDATILGPFCDLALALASARDNHIDVACSTSISMVNIVTPSPNCSRTGPCLSSLSPALIATRCRNAFARRRN